MPGAANLTLEECRETGALGARAAAWNRRAAEIQRLMALGCEDDFDMDLRASWDHTMRKHLG